MLTLQNRHQPANPHLTDIALIVFLCKLDITNGIYPLSL